MNPHIIIGEGYYPYDLPFSEKDSQKTREIVKSFFDSNVEKISKWISASGETNGFIKPYPYIEFKIANTDLIDAGAVRLDSGVYMIYISYGALLFIHDLFNRMLSHKNIFPDIGNSSVETLEDPTLINYGILEPKGFLPKDPIRQKFAAMLIDQAVFFMFQHEHYHILNGHVDLKYEETNEMKFSEFIESKFDPLTERTLEMDADSSSMCWILRTNILFHKEGINHFLPLDKTLKYSFFSIYTLMKLCYGRGQIKLDEVLEFNQHSYTHPTWRLRQYMMIETGIKYIELRHSDKIDKDDFIKEASGLILYSEKVYEILTGKKNIENKEELPHALHFSSPYVKELLDHWKILRPKLEALAYCKLIE